MSSRARTSVEAAPLAVAPGQRSWARDVIPEPRARLRVPTPRTSHEQLPAAPGPAARRSTSWTAGAALVALTLATLFLDAQQAQPLVVLAGIVATLTLLRAPGARACVPGVRGRLLRHPVRLIGAGIGVLALTEAVRPVGAAFPAPADTLTFASYPFILAGLLCLTRARVREAALDTILVAAIVPVSLGAAVWLPLMEANAGWAHDVPGGIWAVGAFLGVDLLAVAIIVRLAVLFRGSAVAYQLLVGAFACILGAHVARTLAAVTDVVPAPFGSQSLLVFGFGLAAAATLHPSLPRAVEGTVLPRASLSRLHLALLLAAVAAGPVVMLLHPGRPEEWVLLAVGSPALVSLLVVAHLARLLRERGRLEHASTHDPLTSLPHRAHFHELLALALARDEARRDGVAVMFIDLDDFKNVNDRLGHAAGDALLRQVADRLRSSTRRGDVVARLGGDEFGVLLKPGTGRGEADDIGNRILAAVGAPIHLPGGSVDVTPSIGIALAPEHGEDADTLVRNADSAMYRAKSAGRNRVQVYDQGIGEQVRARLGVQSRLRTAIDQQEMVLHYQPKVDLQSGTVAGVEALVRWQHPSLGLIGPGAFISQAERSGLIAPLGEWVMRTACAQAEQWRREGLGDLPVSVNISPRQFAFQDVTQMVRSALDDSGLPAHLLEIELTESVSLGDGDAASAMRELDQLGVQCSIDDFGTGYSSISYLHDYRIDTIKIDRSFIAGISRNDRDGPIVRAVIAMAHNLGMRVVAEGVETAEQTEFLRRHGCDQGQGYLFGRPGSERSLRDLVQGLAVCNPISDRPSTWDERELGQRLWLEEQHLLDEHPPLVVDVTDAAAVRAAAQRGLMFLTAASGVVVPLMLGVSAGNGLPAYVQVALNSTLAEAGIATPRAATPGDGASTLLHALGMSPPSGEGRGSARTRTTAARPGAPAAAAAPAASAEAATGVALPADVDAHPLVDPVGVEAPADEAPATQLPVVDAPGDLPPSVGRPPVQERPGATPGLPQAPREQDRPAPRPTRPDVPTSAPAAPERRPEAPRPETARPEAPRPETARPETPRPETARPETARPETARPETPPKAEKPTTPPSGTPPQVDKPTTPPTAAAPVVPARPERPSAQPERPSAAPEATREATPPAAAAQPARPQPAETGAAGARPSEPGRPSAAAEPAVMAPPTPQPVRTGKPG